MPDTANRAPILYISDLSPNRVDPADLFDLAFLLRSGEKMSPAGVVLPESGEESVRSVAPLTARIPEAGGLNYHTGAGGFMDALRAADVPLNVVAVAGYGMVRDVLIQDRALFREKVARLFLVGGHANDYALPRSEGERVPIDPRLKEREPGRFDPGGDGRLGHGADETQALGTLLTSGEGVIWLPRDVCLWRYAAPQLLSDGGPACEWLLRELFWSHLQATPDRFAAGDAPVLLSSIPAFLLTTQPDPLGWLRLFRAVTARVEVSPVTGRVTGIAIKHDRPNLYMVVGIDGRAIGEVVTRTLRIRPLTA